MREVVLPCVVLCPGKGRRTIGKGDGECLQVVGSKRSGSATIVEGGCVCWSRCGQNEKKKKTDKTRRVVGSWHCCALGCVVVFVVVAKVAASVCCRCCVCLLL